MPLLSSATARTSTRRRASVDHLATLFRDHLKLAGVDRAELHASTKTHVQANFRSWRDSGLTWFAMTGLDVAKISRRAGHDTIQTTMGYVKQAEDLTGDLGVPFAPLPAALRVSPAPAVALESPLDGVHRSIAIEIADASGTASRDDLTRILGQNEEHRARTTPRLVNGVAPVAAARQSDAPQVVRVETDESRAASGTRHGRRASDEVSRIGDGMGHIGSIAPPSVAASASCERHVNRERTTSVQTRKGTAFAVPSEREKGFEPSTSTLARWHSTTELLPRP